MTTSGSAGERTGWQVADQGALPDIDGPAADSPAAAKTGPPDDLQELREEIEQTRQQLGETVEELAAKADVKARTRDKAAELTGRVKGKASHARTDATASAGRIRAQLAGANGNAGKKAMAVAAGVLVFCYVAVRRWRPR
jgi:hypothetical protein